MTYKALYRQWRPKTFNEIVGQDHIVQTLKNAIKNDRIAHAYLFCGIRGTGKTSTAKIFAKALNCEKGPTINPCNECSVCNGIDSGRIIDVAEIDGASNRGIEEIRDLRERIKFTPTEGKYKIYIIDEVHMLTNEAFNALLKTLEEPPKHAIFIFATTEPHKLPATILSRCQRFDFRRLTAKDMIEQMLKILKAGGFEAEERALEIIARNAQGAMRDAISVLDQCISYSNGPVTVDVVTDILGTVNDEVLFGFAKTVIERNPEKGMEIIGDIVSKGKDVHQFIKDLIIHFRNLMIAKTSDNVGGAIELPDEIIEDLKRQSKNTTLENIIRILNTLTQAEKETRWSTFPRIIMEMTLVKLTQPQLDDSLDGILDRIRILEEKLEKGEIKYQEKKVIEDKGRELRTQRQTEPNIQAQEETITEKTEKKETESVIKEAEKEKDDVETEKIIVEEETPVKQEKTKDDQIELKDIKNLWKKTIQVIKEEKLPLYYNILEAKAEPTGITSNGLVNFEIKGYEGHKIYIENELDYIESVLNKGREKPFKIRIAEERKEAIKQQTDSTNIQEDKEQKKLDENGELFIEQVKRIFKGHEDIIEIVDEE